MALQIVGHYRIIKKLGAGGMGEVYQAEDEKLGRVVALKILPAAFSADAMRMKRFTQEARTASSLSHPNVTHIYEIGEADGIHYIAMEYIDGVTLDERIRGQYLNNAEIFTIAIQIADALKEAHAKGITHRDLKPSNVMLDRRGELKILDFGLVKVEPSGNQQSTVSQASTQLKTEAGVLLGTIQYMSPEQALGLEVDFRSDIFSFGVLLYEMATGRRPFSGATASATVDKILHTEPEAISRFNYDVSTDLERLVLKCLRKKKSERYQSSADLLADLKVLKQGSGQQEEGRIADTNLRKGEYSLPRNTARFLFVALQCLYLGMYIAALHWPFQMSTGLEHILGRNWAEKLTLLYLVTSMIGIAVRLYLMTNVIWDHVQTGIRYRLLFPFLFTLDILWSVSPFGLSLSIGEIFALACIPPLVFSPFSQRTLIRSAYDLYAPRRTSTNSEQ